MRLVWQARSNPLAWWWGLLILVSTANITLWFLLYREFRPTGALTGHSDIESMLLLCAAYVFGCAFRSFLPRADVQRICLFDTWLSSVLVGRSVATVAELCFAAQWAIILSQLGGIAGADTTLNAAWAVVPLILVAECFSWYAVLTRNYLGNAVENSIWAIAFVMVAIALCRLLPEFQGLVLGADCRDRRDRVLSGVSRDHRCADVSEPLADRPCRRQQASRAHRGTSRCQHALDRDPRSHPLEGRDCLDVALFQRRGLGQPCIVRVLRTRGSPSALSH